MENFTPIMSLTGGVIIGVAGLLLLLFNGRIAGISGIFGGLLQLQRMQRNEKLWRIAFIAGLLCGGLTLLYVYPQAFVFEIAVSPAVVIVAGLLVGFGSRMGGGCTSGHGVCGIGRLSNRSIVAAITFMLTGVVTAVVLSRWFGA